jgi:hypothetical protein
MYTPSVGMDELGKRYTRLTLRYGYKSIERVLSTSELYELWTRSNPYSLGRGLLLKASPALCLRSTFLEMRSFWAHNMTILLCLF